jgi:hypothetical protein
MVFVVMLDGFNGFCYIVEDDIDYFVDVLDFLHVLVYGCKYDILLN